MTRTHRIISTWLSMPSFTIILTIYLVGGLSTRFTDGQSLDISPRDGLTVKLNSGAIFICTIPRDVMRSARNSYPNMLWINPQGQTITGTTGRVFVDRSASTTLKLYIQHIEEADAGTYSCEADVPSVGYLSETTRIVLFEEIRFEDTNQFIQDSIGSAPLLPCAATGQPPPKVSWRFNMRTIPTDTAKYRYEPDGLRIYNVVPGDNGTYECRAEVDSQGNLKIRMITLDVLFPPAILRKPDSTTVIEGEDAVLQCKAQGNPAVTYHWFYEGATPAMAMASMKVRLPGKTDTYKIKNAKMKDEGTYYCRVTNEQGSKEASAMLTVIVPPIVKKMSPVYILESRTLFVDCVASGVPTPTITWKRASSRTPFIEGPQPNDARVHIDTSGEGVGQLIIHDIQRSYTGDYSCTADSIAGSQTQETSLVVEYTPTGEIEETDVWTWPGQVRNLTCMSRGLPKPTINWIRQGEYLDNSQYYHIIHQQTYGDTTRSILTITIPKDYDMDFLYGEYACLAKNKYDHDRSTVVLYQARAPGMARNVKVAKETPTSVQLRFSQPEKDGGLLVTSWRVRSEPQGEPKEKKTSHLFGIGDVVEIKGLKPGTNYTFELAARNSVDWGKPAKFLVRTPHRAATGQADFPGAPVRVGISKKPPPDNGHVPSKTDKATQPGAPKQAEINSNEGDNIGIIVGAGGAVVVIVSILLTVILCRRRHNRDAALESQKKQANDMNGTAVRINSERDVDNIQLKITRPVSDVPPAVPPHQNGYVGSPKQVRPENTPNAQPITNGVGNRGSDVIPPTALSCVSNNPNSAQKRAWDRVLMKQADEDVGGVKRLEANPAPVPLLTDDSPCELPPPPPFLLEGGGGEDYDTASYQDILDGYHSGDNVDDVPLDIRIPDQLV